MEYQTDVRKTPLESKRRKRLLAAFLILTTSILLSCSRKGQDALTPAVTSPGAAPPAARKLFKTGEAVPAGYLGYKVYGSWFTDHLSTQGGAGKSPASYLYVDLGVVNTDKKERPVGPLKLIDEAGRESDLSEKAATAEQSLGQIGKLAPSMSKRAFAIFEVPSGHQYQLKIQGFSAADEVTIELTPTTAPAK